MLVVLNHSESKIQDVSGKLETSDKFIKNKRKFTFNSNDPEESHESSITDEENMEHVLPLGLLSPRVSSKTPLIKFRRRNDYDRSKRSLSQTFTAKSFNNSFN